MTDPAVELTWVLEAKDEPTVPDARADTPADEPGPLEQDDEAALALYQRLLPAASGPPPESIDASEQDDDDDDVVLSVDYLVWDHTRQYGQLRPLSPKRVETLLGGFVVRGPPRRKVKVLVSLLPSMPQYDAAS